MVLRINSNDFSCFAGFKHTDKTWQKHNEELNEYINLFLTNDKIRYFQVRLADETNADTIAYITHKVDLKHYIKTDFKLDGSKTHWLCFYKEDN